MSNLPLETFRSENPIGEVELVGKSSVKAKQDEYRRRGRTSWESLDCGEKDLMAAWRRKGCEGEK